MVHPLKADNGMAEPVTLLHVPPTQSALAGTGSIQYTIRQPLAVKYEPLPDITAYELARLLPYLTSPIYEGDWEALGSANRHLKRFG